MTTSALVVMDLFDGISRFCPEFNYLWCNRNMVDSTIGFSTFWNAAHLRNLSALKHFKWKVGLWESVNILSLGIGFNDLYSLYSHQKR